MIETKKERKRQNGRDNVEEDGGARNNYDRLHWLFHPNVTGPGTNVALIRRPSWKTFVYSPMDKSEHTTLALVFENGTKFGWSLVTITPPWLYVIL